MISTKVKATDRTDQPINQDPTRTSGETRYFSTELARFRDELRATFDEVRNEIVKFVQDVRSGDNSPAPFNSRPLSKHELKELRKNGVIELEQTAK